MKKSSKLITLLLAAAMLLSLLGGCAGTTAPAESAPPTEEAAPSEAAPAEAPADASVAPAEEAPVVDDGTQYYLKDETMTITCWDVWPAFFGTFDEDYQSPGDTMLFKAMEERFNVKFELTIAQAESSAETFNIMAASGDYCDLIYNVASNYTGGIEKAVDDEVILDISKIVADSCPNYAALMENPDIYKNLLTDSGYLGGFCTINTTPQPRAGGGLIRGDWLDDLGLEVPTTTDEFYDVLVAFRDQKGATGALCTSSDGTFGTVSSAFAPMGIYVDGGVVKYGTDTMKDYYSYMHKLYADGLIPVDFMSYTDSFKAPTSVVQNGVCGVMHDDWSNFVTYYESGMAEGQYFVPMPDLAINKGETSNMKAAESLLEGANYASVSTDCAEPELVCKVMDFCYSEEGQLLSDYGIEGETFTYDADGNPQYTDMIVANEHGMPAVLAVYIYIDGCWPHLRNCGRLNYSYSERELGCPEVWNQKYTGSEGSMPMNVSYTDDELAVISTYSTDLSTYMDENYLSFLIGEKDIEKDFDAFIDGLDSFHIDELVAAYQAAYDRYSSR